VRLEVIPPALLNQLDDPARIEIDAEADAASVLREVFDRKAKPARPARAEHEPVGPLRKLVVGERLAEELVVDSEILDVDARLGDARGSTGLEDVDVLVRVGLWHPPPHRTPAQPLVLEQPEFPEIGEALHISERVKRKLLRALEPERAAGRGIKM